MHIIIGLERGGAELMLLRLAKTLEAEYGFEQRIISLMPVDLSQPHLKDLGIPIDTLGLSGSADLPRAFLKLVRLMRSWRPEHVQTWLYHADLLGGLAARLNGVRNVYWGIRVDGLVANGSRATRAIFRLCVPLSRIVPKRIVCCAFSARDAHAAQGYRADKMRVIQNGYELDRFAFSQDNRETLRAQLKIPPDSVVIGNIGRFDPEKDHRSLVQAAAQVCQRHANVEVVLIGKNITPENATLMGWVKDTGFADRFHLLGLRADVPQLLSVMDIYCQPSLNEGFPNVVAEAMAAERVCVLTDFGEAKAMTGDLAPIVRKSDPAALAEALGTQVERSAMERAETGRQLRARVERKFSLKTIAAQYAAFYEAAGEWDQPPND